MFILLINIIMPGVGTIISAVLASEFMTVTVLVGVAQLVTSFILVGFIWAIAWSVVLIKKTRGTGTEYEPILPAAGREAPAEATEGA